MFILLIPLRLFDKILQTSYKKSMNWKEPLAIIGSILAIMVSVMFFLTYAINPRFDSIDSTLQEIKTDIKADRRAMTQRIDHLYQSKADKKSKGK